MVSKTFVVLCILAVVFVFAYASEAAQENDVDSKDAAHDKVNGIEDAKHGYPGQGGGYPGRGGYPGGGYPGRGGYPGQGGGGRYSGGRDSCRFGCCGRRDYNGVCQRCCPHAV